MSFAKYKFRVLKHIGCVFLFSLSAQTMSMPSVHDALLYNNAGIESESVSSSKTHQVVLSAPTRINNAPFIEKETRVEGKKTVMLLRLDNQDTPQAAFAHYRAFMAKHGTVAYSCENRGCGISSYWANSIFEERRLAGRDSDQYYLAGQIDIAGSSYWVSVYLVTNALRQNLVYVTYILQESQKQVWENAYLLFPESKLPSPVVLTLKDQLSQDSRLKLYVAGYFGLDANLTISAGESKLLSAFQGLQKELAAEWSISEDRIEFKIVGPFHSEPPVEKEIWFRLFLLKP